MARLGYLQANNKQTLNSTTTALAIRAQRARSRLHIYGLTQYSYGSTTLAKRGNLTESCVDHLLSDFAGAAGE